MRQERDCGMSFQCLVMSLTCKSLLLVLCELWHFVWTETLSQHRVWGKQVWRQTVTLCLTALVITLVPKVEVIS